MKRNTYYMDEVVTTEKVDVKYFKRLLARIVPYKKLFLLAFILLSCSSLIALLPPFLIRAIVNDVLPMEEGRTRALVLSVVALAALGVTGMTVTSVFGCGVQKGATETYRGVKLDMDLLPKVKVEVVVSKVPVDDVVAAARKVLYSGHIGDGKIFVYDVENVVKVRTGATGYDALQDEEG